MTLPVRFQFLQFCQKSATFYFGFDSAGSFVCPPIYNNNLIIRDIDRKSKLTSLRKNEKELFPLWDRDKL